MDVPTQRNGRVNSNHVTLFHQDFSGSKAKRAYFVFVDAFAPGELFDVAVDVGRLHPKMR